MHRAILFLLLAIFLQSGCSGRSTTLLDPASRDPGQDHWAIASYYSRQAAMSRQQAEELNSQLVIYEQLFGRDSDWVSGTKFLVQFYDEEEREQDRLADLNLELGRGRYTNYPPQ